MTQEVSASDIASSIPDGEGQAEASSELQTQSEGANEAPPTESTEVEPEPNQQEMDFTRRFNALARRERELQARESEYKSKYSDIEKYQQEKDLVKNNPLEFLEKNGWKFKDLADFVLNDQKPTPDKQVASLRQEIEALKAERQREIEERERYEKESKAQQTVNEFKNNIKKVVTENVDQFELVNHFNEMETVYGVIENYYNRTGDVLDIKKAAAEVEKHLESQLEMAAKTNKFKKRFSQAISEEPSVKTPRSQSEQANETRTLTNDAAATSSVSEPRGYLSDEESKARAAEIIRQHMLKKQGYSKFE